MKSRFIGRCDSLSLDQLIAYDESERRITYRTLCKLIGIEAVHEFEKANGYDRHLRLKNDWHVSYGKGKWRGKPCACIHWSSYHHIYLIL